MNAYMKKLPRRMHQEVSYYSSEMPGIALSSSHSTMSICPDNGSSIALSVLMTIQLATLANQMSNPIWPIDSFETRNFTQAMINYGQPDARVFSNWSWRIWLFLSVFFFFLSFFFKQVPWHLWRFLLHPRTVNPIGFGLTRAQRVLTSVLFYKFDRVNQQMCHTSRPL